MENMNGVETKNNFGLEITISSERRMDMAHPEDKIIITRILNEISQEKFYKSYIQNVTRMRGRWFKDELLLDYAFTYKGILHSLDVEIIDDSQYVYKLSCKE